jgi:hypothetical protein
MAALAELGLKTGVDTGLVGLGERGGARTVICRQDAEKGITILRVPSALHLTADSLARWAPAAARVAAPAIGDDAAVAIALALLFARAQAPLPTVPAWLAAYARTLPPARDFAAMPVAWPAAELASLCDASLARSALGRRATLRGRFDSLRDAASAAAAAAAAISAAPDASVPGTAGASDAAQLSALSCALATWRDFLWAVCCVQSRCFVSERPGADGAYRLELVVVPVADMFNHFAAAPRPGGAVMLTDEWDADGALSLRASCAVRTGDELVISYGDRSSRDLLETYGFVLPLRSNAADSIMVPLRSVAEHLQLLKRPTPAHLDLLRELLVPGSQTLLPDEVEMCGGPLADDYLLEGAQCLDAAEAFVDEASLQEQIESSELEWGFAGAADDTMQVLRIVCSSGGVDASLPADRFRRPVSRNNELAVVALIQGMLAHTALEAADDLLLPASLRESFARASASEQAETLAKVVVLEEARAIDISAGSRTNAGESWDCGDNGDGGEVILADFASERACAASQYRRNRLRIVLLHLQHISRLLQVANGARVIVSPGVRTLVLGARRRLSRQLFRNSFGSDRICLDKVELGASSTIVKVLLASRRRDASIMSASDDATGLVAWPSTQLLAAVLFARAHQLLEQGCRVIELGCGAALLSSALAALSSGTTSPLVNVVVATDASADALALARLNLEANAGPLGPVVAVARLRWGEASDVDEIARRWDALSFDLVVASECFYLQHGRSDGGSGILNQARLFFTTAGRLLRRCGCSALGSNACRAGVVLLVYCPRYRGMREPVADAAREASLALRALDIRSGERPLIGELSRGQRDGVASDVRFLLLSPCASAADRAVEKLGAHAGEAGFDDDVYL